MANRPKQRIDYAGWSVNIFSNDTKIDMLLDAQGWDGFGVYFFLCQMAFGSEGYYYEWGYALCASTARKMGGGIGAGTVKETVDYCLQIGLFDKRLFDRWGVLTSRGIQKSYLIVLKSKNRRGTEIYKEYWLLDISEKNERDYQGVVFVSKNRDKIEDNADSLEVNSYSLEVIADSLEQKESKVKESKVKESKGKESKGNKKNITCKEEAFALFEKLWKLYPEKKGKGKISESKKKELLNVGFDEMKRAIDRYEIEWEKDKEWRKRQNGSSFFNSGYEDYLDNNYVPSKKTVSNISKNQFNQFTQNDYDFDQLEKDLEPN